ncbi:transmembrane sensor [Catalinimonas alkaloidigena]|uniref:FecR family protein n=1 Tax=Catalinimonas alkaloidigena TaxID=1075417 RepID=UPI002407262E|nr:FecR family protein [Catalinimonas alkaloidigena]MDF9797912.1 transmembrane sensor [Catalinimonas alkaloidigena]
MVDKDLIDKFYQGKCTDAEALKVLSWFEDQKRGEACIEESWDQDTELKHRSELVTNQSFAAIQRQIDKKEVEKKQYLFTSQIFKVAAILALAITIPFLLIRESELPTPEYVAVKHYITKENPFGSKSKIFLPDGSTVNLNAGSSITYPEGFNDSIRKVALVGEAFFDVAEHKSKPFIVSAAGVDTKALGTSFNVKAYKEDAGVQVVLASGKVKVCKPKEKDSTGVFLKPGEEAYVEKNASAIFKQQADLYSTLAWKDNIIVFQDAPAQRIFTTLERWYGVEFILPEGFFTNAWSFTGEFENENLENVLESISYVKGFQFRINQKSIIITT